MNEIFLRVKQENFPEGCNLNDIFQLSLIKDGKFYGPAETFNNYNAIYRNPRAVESITTKLKSKGLIEREDDKYILTHKGKQVFSVGKPKDPYDVLEEAGVTPAMLKKCYDIFLGPSHRTDENKMRVVLKLVDLQYNHEKLFKELKKYYPRNTGYRTYAKFPTFFSAFLNWADNELHDNPRPIPVNYLNLKDTNKLMLKYAGYLKGVGNFKLWMTELEKRRLLKKV